MCMCECVFLEINDTLCSDCISLEINVVCTYVV